MRFGIQPESKDIQISEVLGEVLEYHSFGRFQGIFDQNYKFHHIIFLLAAEISINNSSSQFCSEMLKPENEMIFKRSYVYLQETPKLK